VLCVSGITHPWAYGSWMRCWRTSGPALSPRKEVQTDFILLHAVVHVLQSCCTADMHPCKGILGHDIGECRDGALHGGRNACWPSHMTPGSYQSNSLHFWPNDKAARA
jgi:hypothetical protein